MVFAVIFTRIRTKILSMKPVDYFSTIIAKTEQDLAVRAPKVVPKIYDFVRALESVLERGDLNEILIRTRGRQKSLFDFDNKIQTFLILESKLTIRQYGITILVAYSKNMTNLTKFGITFSHQKIENNCAKIILILSDESCSQNRPPLSFFTPRNSEF